MAIGIAESIAFIQAAMQAIDLYARYGGDRQQFIQTLNLEYHPQKYVEIEEKVVALGPSYTGVFSATRTRVQECMDNLQDGILDNLLPNERARLGDAAKSCVCRQIKILKDFMGERIPPELRKVWQEHDCDDFFTSLNTGTTRGLDRVRQPETA